MPESNSPGDRRTGSNHAHTTLRTAHTSLARSGPTGANRRLSAVSIGFTFERTRDCRTVSGRPSERTIRTPRSKSPGVKPPDQAFAHGERKCSATRYHAFRGLRGWGPNAVASALRTSLPASVATSLICAGSTGSPRFSARIIASNFSVAGPFGLVLSWPVTKRSAASMKPTESGMSMARPLEPSSVSVLYPASLEAAMPSTTSMSDATITAMNMRAPPCFSRRWPLIYQGRVSGYARRTPVDRRNLAQSPLAECDKPHKRPRFKVIGPAASSCRSGSMISGARGSHAAPASWGSEVRSSVRRRTQPRQPRRDRTSARAGTAPAATPRPARASGRGRSTRSGRRARPRGESACT